MVEPNACFESDHDCGELFPGPHSSIATDSSTVPLTVPPAGRPEHQLSRGPTPIDRTNHGSHENERLETMHSVVGGRGTW